MNPSDWMVHLSLWTALYRSDFLAHAPHPAPPERRPAARARRAAVAAVALLAPALLVIAALVGG